MKKTMKMMLAMMAGAMVFTACSSDDILENIENNEVAQEASQLKPMTFTAIQEGQGTTRATIDGLDIKWTAGDKISIFDGATENAGVQEFTLATGEGTTSATFTGSAKEDAGTYYALYPYAVGTSSESRVPTKEEAEAAAGSCSSGLDSWKEHYPSSPEMILNMATNLLDREGVSEENKTIVLAYIKGDPTTMINRGVELDGSSIKNVVIPAEQTATAGSAYPKAMIMVAKGDDKDALKFMNVCAYVKVTPHFDCCAISLTSADSDRKLAGKVTVNYSGAVPTTTVTADGTNSVYLVGTITAGNTYYIAVRPEALTAGFTIEFLTADKNTYYARSTSKALNLTRSNVKNLGEFTTSGTWTRYSATSGNDGAGHDWLLVTPTLKINTPASFENVLFSNITTWTGWELPSADELFEAWSNGAFTENSGSYTFRGIGILKYGKSAEVSGYILNAIWTSTPWPGDDTQQSVIRINSNDISWYPKTSTNMKACCLRKYNN